jgi:CBS domain-containing protein/gamma-glutamylcysteine synthetase
MGEEKVHLASQPEDMQNFVRHLLRDVQALEYMLENDWFEDGVTRIGAEQEMCLINKEYKPAYTAMQILEEFHPEWLTTELAQFNLEANLSPRVFEGNAFGDMEEELRQHLREIQAVATKHDSRILLTGILPSLRKFDLNLDKLTPKERYLALMMALKELRGSDYELHIDGIDELKIRHDSPLLEACNTSFQVHLQVHPRDFTRYYNFALALAGPTLAMAANSPVLFGKRLWHETRIALFQQSIDSRSNSDHMRDRSPRVTFGKDWLKKSILEIYREDIMRFRILLGTDITGDSLSQVHQGITPKLQALQVHNGTVYRWNRPCYGISPNGKPHLRIENRIFGAGPTVLDEMANTAFWLGAMEGMADEYADISQHMGFEDALDNFTKGARTGIDSKFTWLNNEKINAIDLTKEYLVPLAKKGLEKRKVNPEHIDKYLGIIQERAEKHMNGARWILMTYTKFMKETNHDESATSLTAAIWHNQAKTLPAHTWKIPTLHEFDQYDPSGLLVEEFMSTDLFTVQKEDIIEFAAALMAWGNTECLPVEDKSGKLVGLVTNRQILECFTKRTELLPLDTADVSSKKQLQQIVQSLQAEHCGAASQRTVENIMLIDPITISPQTTILEVIALMNQHKIKVLPVVKNQELVGVISEKDFMVICKRLIQRLHSNKK